MDGPTSAISSHLNPPEIVTASPFSFRTRCPTESNSLSTLTRVVPTHGAFKTICAVLAELTAPLLCRKVVFLLKELGLAYEPLYLDFQKGEHKAPEYLKVNPNGRVPALVDHKNNDYTVW